MTSERVTVSLPADVKEAAQRVAAESGVPFSSVVNDALAAWLRSRLIDSWLVAYQEEFGAFSEDELRELAEESGMAWRDGGRQARLARALPMIEVQTVTVAEAKAAGELLAAAGSADVIDSLLALLTRPADKVLTSDPSDLRRLLDARQVRAEIIVV